MKITAQDLYEYKIIDQIIKEPYGGAHRNPRRMALYLKKQLLVGLDEIKDQNIDKLLESRYNKFRSFGA